MYFRWVNFPVRLPMVFRSVCLFCVFRPSLGSVGSRHVVPRLPSLTPRVQTLAFTSPSAPCTLPAVFSIGFSYGLPSSFSSRLFCLPSLELFGLLCPCCGGTSEYPASYELSARRGRLSVCRSVCVCGHACAFVCVNVCVAACVSALGQLLCASSFPRH